MAKSCIFSPVDKNNKPYKALSEYKKALGAKTGSRAFLKALSPSFQKRYAGKLDIDEQGVATLESAMKIPAMKELVGFQTIKESLEKQYGFNTVDNTADNFRMLINEAKTFNDQNEEYVAFPEKVDGGIKNIVHKKDGDSVKVFNSYYGSTTLNDRLLEIFSPLGLSVGDLTEAEGGYSGIVDFENARSIAGEFVNLIRVANNMEGQLNMSEEFAHLIVRMLKGQPLIQRSINALAENESKLQEILGDDYQAYVEQFTDTEGNVDMVGVAEEALGRILQRNLLNETIQQQEDGYLEKMWKRLVNFIKKLFKGYDYNQVNQAIVDADQAIDTLAKDLLSGTLGFTKENIESTFSNDRMYHLESNLDYLKTVIEGAIATETKKKIIVKQDKAQERAQKKIDNLNAILDKTPEGRLKGIINYAHSAVNDLGAAREALGKVDASEANFSMLRGVRSTIQSYEEFLKQLGSLINSQDEELTKLIAETSIEDKHKVIVTLKSAYDELASLDKLVRDKFKDVAFEAIENFFKPFFGVEGKFTDSTGKERSLRELIQEANGDIGFVDRYLITMSNSGDLLLQLFDEVVKKAKADARYDTIEDIKEITRLMLDAEEKGITSFDWMYEKDSEGKKTGNYISAINTGQWEKDRDEFFKKLEEDYGLNPSGAEAKQKKANRKAWFEAHGRMRPEAKMYHNPVFDTLTSAQKEILDRFMQLKQKMDKRLPSNKTSLTRAIQMRRTGQQRMLNSFSNPTQAFQNIKESIAKELTKSSDDDAIYGTKTGLRSFDGSEFKVLPALYTTKLSNPEELTTDVFSALAAYSYSTNTYKEMDKVVDPLEVAKGWVNEYRKVKSLSNGKELVEKIKGKNPVVNAIFENTGSNIEKKLDDFMDAQVYQRYYADSDKTINVMGREVKAGKIVNKWLSISSMVQLGFNALAHLGNVATGTAMQNIEAFSGHYFNAKELLLADKEYATALMSFLPEAESKNPTNKLALFDQLFDIKQEFGDNTKNRMNTIFEKLFGKSLAFLGQTCGDHWLYNRTAIAMCLRKKVKIRDGSVISLWDALHVENAFKGDDRIKELVIDAVDADTGEKIDREYIRKYSAKINEINHRLFGVYNTDDMVAAQRVALGRCILQYRQWIVPMFARRFQERRYVAALGEYEEGYYRTVLNLAAGLKNGLSGIAEVWDEFDEGQKRNVYRAIVEVSQFMLIWAIANFVDFGKGDPDRSWRMKLAEYMAQRELHELGNLTPSFTMGNEILKTVKSPATVLNTTQAALNLTASLLDPRDWTDEIESGKYEGMSTLHKNILKAPFPILAPFNQFDRFIDNIEEVTRYYARPN